MANCAVVGLPDEKWGKRVHAVIVCKPGSQVSEDDIRDYTKTVIAGYKASRTVEFVESLPIINTGKIDKR